MSRVARIAGWSVIGLAAAVTLGYLAVQAVTRTSWGQERVRRFAIRQVNDRIHGELAIGKLGGPGLLSGVTVRDVTLRDPHGRPFIAADSLRAEYDWKNLLRGRIVIETVTLYSPEVHIEKLPGDTLWNYERIFGDTLPDQPKGPRRLIAFDDARIVDGRIFVRRPWEPDHPVEPSDTARLILEEAPGGLVSVWRFEDVNAELAEVIWETPEGPGKLVVATKVSARAYIYEDPVELRQVRGEVTVVDSIISFDLPEVRLPSSRTVALGRLITTDQGIRYDVKFDSADARFTDLQWLYPDLPDEGEARLTLRVQSQQPKGTLFLAENARISAPGTQMAGTVGIVAGDTLYFTHVDLRASPLDVRFIESLLPGKLPVEGLLIGTIEVKGPLSALETKGDLRFTQDSATGSEVRWTGVFDVRERGRGISATSLSADVARLDLGLISAFRPDFPLEGSVEGHVEASGRLDGELRVDGALRHQAGGRPGSRVQGGGTITFTESATQLDLQFDSAAVALEEVATFSPALAGLNGQALGRVRVSGPVDRIGVVADMITRAGGVTFDSYVARTGAGRRINASGSVRGLRLDALMDSLPDATVTGRFELGLEGQDLATYDGRVRFDLDSARIAGWPVDRAAFRGALESGVLRVDTFTAATRGVNVVAHGAFGLVEGRSGDVTIEARTGSLVMLEPVLFDEVVDPMKPRVAGSGQLIGSLSGNLAQFEMHAAGTLERLVYDDASAGTATLRISGAREHGAMRVAGEASADSVVAFGQRLDSARLAVSRDNDVTLASVAAWQAGRPLLVLDGSAWPDEAETAVRIDRLAFGPGGSEWALVDTTLLSLGSSGIRFQDVQLRATQHEGAIRAAGSLAWAAEDSARADWRARPLDFSIDIENVPFRDAVRPLRAEIDAAGLLNGRVRVTGVAGAPEIQGEMTVDTLRFENARLDQVSARFDYGATRLDAQVEGFHNGRRVLFGEGKVPIDLRFVANRERRLDAALDLSLQADSLPAGLVLAPFEDFRNVEGLIDGRITAQGTAREPVFGGSLSIRRGAATLDAVGVRYRDVLGTLLLEPGRSAAVDLVATAVDPRNGGEREGGAQVRGSIDFSDVANPALDLTVEAQRFLAARRRDVDLRMSGTLQLDGRYRAPVISGEVIVDRGTLFIDEIYRQYLIVGLEDPVLFQVVDTSLVSVRRVLPPSENPFLRNLVVRAATVSVGTESWLRSREMNVQVTGDLAIDFDRQKEDLTLAGTLEVVRGTYRFDYKPFARIFEVRDGTVEFPGTPGIDPNLDITAAYRARAQSDETIEILAQLTGTLQSPRVRLTSDAEPPISESDLASYLFFGAPTYAFNIGSVTRSGSSDANGGGAAGIGLQAAQAAFNAYGFGYFAGGLQSLAQSFGLVDYVGLSAAESAGPQDGQGFGGLLAGTELELGRYLTPRSYLAWTTPLRSPGRAAGIRLEWRFHPTYTMEMFWEDRFARSPFGLTSLGTTLEPRRNAGFFLFREWGY